MNIADGIFCDLRHGVKLEIYRESGRLKLQMVGDFLAKAIEHFKHHLHVLKTDRYTGNPFCQTFNKGRMKLGTMQLSYACKEGEQPLTAALWTDAVISAYTSVNEAEQIIEDLAAWKEAVVADGQSPFLREVVGMLEKPDGALPAMQAMLKNSLERDLASGQYKPGQVTKLV